MPLHPFLAAKVHLLDGVTWEAAQNDPVLAARAAEFYTDPAEAAMPDVTTEDRAIPGPHGDIPIRIYRPRGEARRALLWLHGGGFTGGDIDMIEGHIVAGELAARADALVVSVAYRLADATTRFPIPIDDVHAAWFWLTEGEGSALIPPLSPSPSSSPSRATALGGASAGAALALSTAIRLRDQGEHAPDKLLLAYPFVHFPVPALDDATAAVMIRLSEMLRFTTEGIEHMVRTYVGRLTELPPEALPGAARLTDLPPTAIALSEYDDLRPSGELLATQLKESGVPVQTYLAAGMLHGHLNRSPSLEPVDHTLDWLASVLTA